MKVGGVATLCYACGYGSFCFHFTLHCFHVQELYALGDRAFFVLNLAPIGCYLSFLVELPHGDMDIDEFGCLIS
ncbi:hypothetical protein Hanom_Chr06g00488901 [Helianthus anomalus]